MLPVKKTKTIMISSDRPSPFLSNMCPFFVIQTILQFVFYDYQYQYNFAAMVVHFASGTIWCNLNFVQ